jgi:hypothetical protein
VDKINPSTNFTPAIMAGIQIPEGLDHNRPLMEQTILWMINNLDKHAHLIKERDPTTLFFCAEVCRELMYRGTGLEPMDFMTPFNRDKILNPDEKVLAEIRVMGMDVHIINNPDQIGWTVMHPFSGYIATMTYNVH